MREKIAFQIDELKNSLRMFYRAVNDSGLLSVFRFILIFILLTAGLVLIYERSTNPSMYGNFFDSVWYIIVSITTTGYGDKVPITVPGRLVGMLVMFSGVIMLSVLAGTVSSVLVARKIKEAQGLQEIRQKGHILICGWNNNVENIIFTLRSAGEKGEIILINELPENEVANVLFKYKQNNVRFVRGDFTQEEVLLRSNIKEAKAAIIVPEIGGQQVSKPDERTVLATLTMKNLNSKLRVFAHIIDKNNRSHLKRANADGILVSDEFSGFLLANFIVYPGVPQAIGELMKYSEGSEIYRAEIPDQFFGKSFGELFTYFRQEKGSICIGIGYEEKGINIGDVLSSDTTSYLDDFIKRKFAESGKKIGEERIKIQINPRDDHPISDRDFAIIISEEHPS